MIAALPLITSAVTSVLGPSQTAMPSQAAAAVGGTDFSSLLSQLTSGTVDKMNKAESVSTAGIQGKATTQAVVEAVMSAQEALQTALAVRDKAVSAFQEISRLSI